MYPHCARHHRSRRISLHRGRTARVRSIFIYVCMYIYIYSYIIHIYTYTCMHTYIYIYICVHIHTHIHMRTDSKGVEKALSNEEIRLHSKVVEACEHHLTNFMGRTSASFSDNKCYALVLSQQYAWQNGCGFARLVPGICLSLQHYAHIMFESFRRSNMHGTGPCTLHGQGNGVSGLRRGRGLVLHGCSVNVGGGNHIYIYIYIHIYICVGICIYMYICY